MFYQEPGDVLFCRSAYQEHWVTKITKGERYCNTRFNEENVLNPLPLWVKCPVPGCGWSTGRVASVRGHIRGTHAELSDAEVDEVMKELRKGESIFSEKEVESIGHSFQTRTKKKDEKERKRSVREEKKKDGKKQQ